MRNCPICNSEGEYIFSGKLLEKYDVKYFQCPKCALVYTEEPYWLDEAYSDSISQYDTGIMQRNMSNMLFVNLMLLLCFPKANKFLDWGGGYGIFTRLMRDLGYDWLWYDKYSENLLARGFEHKESAEDNGKKEIDLISAFELFEHFVNPYEEFKKLISITKSLIVSTEVYDDGRKVRRFDDWWYYAPQTGQHISFYSAITLEYLAKENNVQYYKIGNTLHLFTERKLSKIKLMLLKNPKFMYLQYYFWNKRRKKGLAIKDKQFLSE